MASGSSCRGRTSPPRSPRSRARPPTTCRRSSPTRSPRTPTRSSPTSKRGLTTEQYRALVDIGAPYLTFDAHPARTYSDGAVAGNLVGFMGIDGDPLAGIEQSQNDCLLATDGNALVPEGQGRRRHPGHRGAAARCQRRNTSADHQPRPAVVPAAADRRAGAGHGRPARHDHRRRGQDRQDPRRRRVPLRRPERSRGIRDREPVQPHLHRHVRARIDLQGSHRGDRARRRRPGSHVHRRRLRLGELPERGACDETPSTTRPTPTRSPACSSTRRTRASRCSASG